MNNGNRHSYRTDDGKIVSYTTGKPCIDFSKGPSFVMCELCGRQIPKFARIGMLRATICERCLLTIDDEWCDKHGVDAIDRHEIKVEQEKARRKLEETRSRITNCGEISREGEKEESLPSSEPVVHDEENGTGNSLREMRWLVIFLMAAIAMVVVLFARKGSCP